MKPSRTLMAVLVFILLPHYSYAEKLTLEDLYKIAVKNREIVKSYQLEKEKARLEVAVQKGDFLPSLDAGYKANKLDEDSVFEKEENSEFSVSLTQNLFAGFKDRSELEISKLDNDLAGYSLSSIKQDISLQVSTAVLGIYQADSRRRVAEDAYRAYSEKYENTKLKYSVGVAKKRDLLIMKVEKDDAEQILAQAENEVRKTLNILKRISGVKLSLENIDFDQFENLPVFDSFEKYITAVFDKRADIKILKSKIKKAEESKKIARASYYPKLDLVLAKKFTSDEYSAFDSETGEDESRIQVNFGINLFDGMKKYRKIDQAFIEEKRAAFELDELETELSVSLENLLLDAETAEKNLFVANEGITEAKENLRITELSYDKGVAAAADVLDSIYYLSRARTNKIEAKAGIFKTWFQIKRLIVDYPEN